MKRQKINILFTAFLCILLVIPALSQIEIPQLSPKAYVSQRVGFTDVELDYSRPSMRGRTIFGDLVPYDKVWRTGANASTNISFSTDVTLENNKVPAGDYTLFTIPGEKEWTIILNRNLGKWGSYTYQESSEVLRFKVIPTSSSYHFETFTIDVGEITQTSATIQLMWENTIVRMHMGTGADAEILAQIDKKLKNPMVHLGNTYYSAAGYYVDTHKDMDQALEWINEALKINGKELGYLHLKAEILAEKGEYRQALQVEQEMVELAKADGSDTEVERGEASIEKWKRMMKSK